MPAINPVTSKLKAQLKLSINRLRLVQQKETAVAKQQRRAMAQLLEAGKEQSARIRVENIIREDINVELLEILELYCELLLARIGLLEAKDCDPGLEEAVKTIIYAAPRTEIKELYHVRELLVHKFSKEFTIEAVENVGGVVPEKVIKRLSVEPPTETLVTLYLREIARAYNVPFSQLYDEEELRLHTEKEDEDNNDDDDDEGPRSGLIPVQPIAITADEKETPSESKARRLSQVANLPDPDTTPKSPISISGPAPTIDNPRPVIVLPPKTAAAKPAPRSLATKKSAEDQELDDLRKRFEALRKR